MLTLSANRQQQIPTIFPKYLHTKPEAKNPNPITIEGGIHTFSANTPKGQISVTLKGQTGSPVGYGIYKQVFPIVMNTGLMDFEIVNGDNVLWLFPDGTKSTLNRPAKTLTEPGIVLLFATNFSDGDIRILDNNTDANYVGDLSDLPLLTNYASFNNTGVTGNISALSNITNYASFYNTGVTGNISALSNITHTANFDNTGVTGNISALSNITYYAGFYNTGVTGDISALSKITNYANFYNTGVTGNISALSNITHTANFSNTGVTGNISALSKITYYANFNNTGVTGVLNPHPNLKYLMLANTNLSTNDVDQTVINLDTNTTATGTRELNITGLTRTSASTAAINSLISKGWNVIDGTVV